MNFLAVFLKTAITRKAVESVARHVLVTGGAYLVSNGYVDQSNMNELVGGGSVLIGGAWAIWSKRIL